MQRFRRKSELRGSKKEESTASASPDPPAISAPPTLELPELASFRTSLILPHLTKRFSLLRDAEGNLVDWTTLEQKLASQRQTGHLTDDEANAVLAQFRLESQADAPPVPRVPRQRLDWSGIDLNEGDEVLDSTAASARQSQVSDPRVNDSAGRSSWGRSSHISAVSTPNSRIAPVTSTASSMANDTRRDSAASASASSLPYRGGGSLYGRRVSKDETKLSQSSSSIASGSGGSSMKQSGSSRTMPDDEGSPQLGETSKGGAETDGEDIGTTQEQARKSYDGATAADETAAAENAALGAGDPKRDSTTPLTPTQIKRISNALDQIEAELSPRYSRRSIGSVADQTGFTEDLTSPHSDTEAMDPDAHLIRHSLSPSAATPLREDSEISSDLPAPTTIEDSPDSLAPSRTLETGSAIPLPDSPPSSVRTSVRSSIGRLPPLDVGSPRSTRQRELSSTSTDYTVSPKSPTAQTLRTISSRSELDQTSSDNDGPFDLSFGSNDLRPGENHDATTGARPIGETEDSVEILRPGQDAHRRTSTGQHSRNASASTVSSTGSSYHAAVEDVENEITFPSGSTGTINGEGSPGTEALEIEAPKIDFLRVESEDMSRRPSDELLETINSSSPALGEADLALEDLMMIQETLVHRAALRKKEGYESRSPYSDATGSPEVNGSDGRRGSGSDGRRGSDGTSASVPDERRKSHEADRAKHAAYRASRATAATTTTGTSLTGSSPTNGVPTPSSLSDAFEFSSLVGSPESEAWEDARDRLRSPSDNTTGQDQSPASVQSSTMAQTGLGIETTAVSPVVVQSTRANDATESTPAVSPEMDAPVEFEADAVAVPREPLPVRNKVNTQSMLIRDVRNQANLATIALKKQPVPSSPTPPSAASLRKSRSGRNIRKGSISSPQLLSGTSDIPAVPILNPEIVETPSSPQSPHAGRTRRDEGLTRSKSKSKGFGSRFKSLLRKQSRDQLPHLNGDEVTPFDVEGEGHPRQDSTPPNQHVSSFAAPVDETEPVQSSPNLAVVEEQSENGSPSINSVSSGNSSGRLTRMLLRAKSSRSAKERRESSETTLQRNGMVTPELQQSAPSVMDTPLARQVSPPDATFRRAAMEQETMGLGIASGGGETSRAPISYDIGSRRRRLGSDDAAAEALVSQSAPLSLNSRRPSADTSGVDTFAFPSSASTPTAPLSPRRDRQQIRHERNTSNASAVSVDSERRLREAAEELGLPPDKVEELVTLSYAGSPTASHGRSASSGSLGGRRSEDSDTARRRHTRDPSDTSSHGSAGRRYAKSSMDSSALQEEDTTMSAAALSEQGQPGPPPRLGPGLRIAVPSSLSAGSSKRDSLSVRPPISPGAFSTASYRSSGYAGSVFDLYGSEDSESEARMEAENGEGEIVLGPASPTQGAELVEQADGSLVWKVVDDLRRHSAATGSSGSIDFGSRPASVESSSALAPTATGTDPLAAMLRHHRRNMSSGGDFTRNPTLSLYVRDEQRLVELAQEGGVADEADGHFYVRPKAEAEGNSAGRTNLQE